MRCRWAVGNECGDSYYYGAGVCQDFPATLSMVYIILVTLYLQDELFIQKV